MKEFLTSGQFGVNRSRPERQRGIWPQVNTETLQGLSRSTPAKESLEFCRILFITHSHGSIGQRIGVPTAFGLTWPEKEPPALAATLLNVQMLVHEAEHHNWLETCRAQSVSEEGVGPRELGSRMQLATKCRSGWELGSDPKSISDWASDFQRFVSTKLAHTGYELVRPGAEVAKPLVSFVGRTRDVSGDTAYVTALNESTGERFEAECDVSFLRDRGIAEGAEFSCTVTRKGEQTIVEFAPLPPRVLSEVDFDEISKEVDSRLK